MLLLHKMWMRNYLATKDTELQHSETLLLRTPLESVALFPSAVRCSEFDPLLWKYRSATS